MLRLRSETWHNYERQLANKTAAFSTGGGDHGLKKSRNVAAGRDAAEEPPDDGEAEAIAAVSARQAMGVAGPAQPGPQAALRQVLGSAAAHENHIVLRAYAASMRSDSEFGLRLGWEFTA